MRHFDAKGVPGHGHGAPAMRGLITCSQGSKESTGSNGLHLETAAIFCDQVRVTMPQIGIT